MEDPPIKLPPAPPVPPKTTEQEDLTTAGQRKINLIWEYTQASIAIVVVLCTMAAGIASTIWGEKRPVDTILSVAFGTVVGFYFGRTNHTARGGIGPQPGERYYSGR